jgi:DUF4097 and DUF4098 domain-containing protein YvlB
MMKRRTPGVVVALSIAAAISAFGVTEEKIHKQFNAAPGGTLVVDVDFGQIQVKTNADQQVVVDVWRRVTRGRKADEEAFLKSRPVQFSASGGTIRVESRGKPEVRFSLFSRSWSSRNEATYTISVPSNFKLQLKTAGGGIGVKETTGDVNARTSGGKLDFAGVRGSLDGHTSGGGIYVRNCEGDIQIRTSGGSIEVVGGAGKLDGKTSGGGITLERFGGPARIITSGGSIRIREAAGALEASTSGGSIEASMAAFDQPVKLTTSGGHVSVRVPGDAAFDLDAHTSGGRVTSELSVSPVGKTERNRLVGKVNEGGHSLFLRSSGGSIQVRKRS